MAANRLIDNLRVSMETGGTLDVGIDALMPTHRGLVHISVARRGPDALFVREKPHASWREYEEADILWLGAKEGEAARMSMRHMEIPVDGTVFLTTPMGGCKFFAVANRGLGDPSPNHIDAYRKPGELARSPAPTMWDIPWEGFRVEGNPDNYRMGCIVGGVYRGGSINYYIFEDHHWRPMHSILVTLLN
ncbi:hypothetical protein Pelo_13282 [Pelomyxa schiedti]|nr:hypothetical protein Pelo_13282 [Pelomyxa schiedti]